MSVDNPTTNEKQPGPSCSEAEVRLVVRFIVEEHIVFNGKVEKVNQLESEELTRIVSRIAWDGAKDKNKSSPNPSEVPKNLESLTDITENTRLDLTVPESSKTTQRDSSSALSSPINIDIDQNSSLGHSSSNNFIGSVSNEQTYRNSHHTTAAQECDLQFIVSQPKTVGTSDIEVCSSNILDECQIIDDRPKNDSPKIQEIKSSVISVKPSLLPNADEDELKSDVEVIDSNKQDAVIESQTISDTLNDCLKIVELEDVCTDGTASTRQLLSINREQNIRSLHDYEISPEPKIDSDVIIVEGLDHIANYGSIEIEETTIPYDVEANISSIQATATYDREEKGTYNYDNSHSAFNHHIKTSIDHTPSTAVNLDKNKEISNATTTTSTKTTFNNVNNNTSTNKRKAAQNNSGKRARKDSQKDTKISGKQRYEIDDESSRKFLKDQMDSRSRVETARALAPMPSVIPPATSAPLQTTFHNKVFAKWSDNHFYPGTILRQVKGRKFVIGFFDNAQRTVSEMDLIPIRNIEGKQVRVSIAKDYCVNALVHNQRSFLNDQPMFNVEYQQDGLIRKCVPMKDIFLTGEQGTPLINQVDKNSAASNFADVDLDNIIYEKRSRKQELEDYELAQKELGNINNQTTTTTTGSKRKSRTNQHNSRNTNQSRSTKDIIKTTNSTIIFNDSPGTGAKKVTTQSDSRSNQGSEIASSPDTSKINSVGPNSNSPSEGSSPIVTTNVPHEMELDQDEFYYSSSSPHRTKTSLLL